jgi:hypothetical protein
MWCPLGTSFWNKNLEKNFKVLYSGSVKARSDISCLGERIGGRGQAIWLGD